MPEDDTDTVEKRPFLGLSLTQLVGGSAAAATAAILGARLGTTGTIIGAALVSLVSAVASAIYTASIKRTREVAARAKEMLPTGQWSAVRARQPLPEVAEQAAAEAEEAAEESTPPVWKRISWKPVAVATGTFFVIAALLITGFELATGKSVEGGGRTTLNNAFHGGTHSSSTPTPTPTPSKKPTSTTSASTTPTGTPTESATPTETPSKSPTESPTTTPTPSASVSAPQPTGSPTR